MSGGCVETAPGPERGEGPRPLRIRFLGDARSVHLLRFARHFALGGHDVGIITFRSALPEFHALPEVRVAEVGGRPATLAGTAWRSLLSLPRLLRAVRAGPPDIVHAHGALSYGLLARVSARPYVLTPWGSDLLIHARGSRILDRLARHVVRCAAIVLYDGDVMAERLRELGARRHRMAPFQFGTDVELFTPEKRSDGLRRELGAGADGQLVISTRNLAPLYDVGTLIRAAPVVLRAAPDARFLIGSDGPERGNLERLAAELGVADRVRFLGRMPPERLAAHFASSDVYVSTARSDSGIACSTAEAMACGVPAVVTDFGDNAQWVRDGVNGFVFAPGDSLALADRLVTVLRDAGLRERCRRANRERIVRDSNAATEMDRIEAIYRRLLALGPDRCLVARG